jgi:hypothetical protein
MEPIAPKDIDNTDVGLFLTFCSGLTEKDIVHYVQKGIHSSETGGLIISQAGNHFNPVERRIGFMNLIIKSDTSPNMLNTRERAIIQMINKSMFDSLYNYGINVHSFINKAMGFFYGGVTSEELIIPNQSVKKSIQDIIESKLVLNEQEVYFMNDLMLKCVESFVLKDTGELLKSVTLPEDVKKNNLV